MRAQTILNRRQTTFLNFIIYLIKKIQRILLIADIYFEVIANIDTNVDELNLNHTSKQLFLENLHKRHGIRIETMITPT